MESGRCTVSGHRADRMRLPKSVVHPVWRCGFSLRGTDWVRRPEGPSYRPLKGQIGHSPSYKEETHIFGELRNICRGMFVYTSKTTRGVGD
jgi:hypothetical protein